MNSKPMKAVLDVQRMGRNALRAHSKHERRAIGDVSHCDPNRRKDNKSFGLDPDPQKAVEAYLAKTGAQIDERNETPFTRVLLSASPEYFAREGGGFDKEKTEAWVRASVAWLRKEMGSDLVHCALHLDEKTPHLHAVIVPTYEKQTKRKKAVQVSHHQHPAFSGVKSFEKLHDRYAEALAGLGIQRGTPMPEDAKEQKKHKDKRRWTATQAKQVLAASAVVDVQKKKADKALASALEKEKAAELKLAAAAKIAEDLGEAHRAAQIRKLRQNQKGRSI